MVKYTDALPKEPQLDAIFAALGDTTRRSILARLATGPASVNEIAAPFDMSLPAISKHLKVLERAGLMARERQGRVHLCRVEPDGLAAANGWIEHMRGFWEERLDNLDTYLNTQKENSDEFDRSE